MVDLSATIGNPESNQTLTNENIGRALCLKLYKHVNRKIWKIFINAFALHPQCVDTSIKNKCLFFLVAVSQSSLD